MTVDNNTNKYTENRSGCEVGDFKFLVHTGDGLRSVVYVDENPPVPDQNYILIPTGDSLYGVAAFCIYYSISQTDDVMISNSTPEYIDLLEDNDDNTFDN